MAAEDEQWSEYRMLIVSELERLGRAIEALRERLEEMEDARRKELGRVHVEIAMLKVKAGIWGLMGAAIPICVAILLEWLKR